MDAVWAWPVDGEWLLAEEEDAFLRCGTSYFASDVRVVVGHSASAQQLPQTHGLHRLLCPEELARSAFLQTYI